MAIIQTQLSEIQTLTTSLYRYSSTHSFANETLFRYASMKTKIIIEMIKEAIVNERFSLVTNAYCVSSLDVAMLNLLRFVFSDEYLYPLFANGKDWFGWLLQ